MSLIIKATFLLASVLALPANVKEEMSPSSTSVAASKQTPYQWDLGWNTDFTIHSSCNDTQFNQISAGLREAKIISQQAKDHTSRWGNESEIFQKYFGNATTAEVIGWYDLVVNGQNDGYIFRCDNIDGNCDNEGWAGHWRGENATNENVICDLSYTDRLYLSQMCSQGFTVANSKNTLFWASDLLHRLWHTSMGQDVVGHYADTYEECLELAKTTPSEAVKNSATLRYYALDVYAYDVSVPGVGCAGELEESHDHDHDESSSTTSTKTSTSTSAKSTETSSTTKAKSTKTSSTTKSKSTKTSTANESCHTHDDGEVHCV